jgi:hypothetical protein
MNPYAIEVTASPTNSRSNDRSARRPPSASPVASLALVTRRNTVKAVTWDRLGTRSATRAASAGQLT